MVAEVGQINTHVFFVYDRRIYICFVFVERYSATRELPGIGRRQRTMGIQDTIIPRQASRSKWAAWLRDISAAFLAGTRPGERLDAQGKRVYLRPLPDREDIDVLWWPLKAVYGLMESPLPLLHISEPTRQAETPYAAFCSKQKTIIYI